MDRLRLALWLAPAAACVVLLWPALGNGFTNWDDPLYLLHNPLTAAPLSDGLGGLLMTRPIGYPIPVTVLAYAGQRAAFGLDPTAFHAVSLALHAVVVIAAGALARRLGASAIAAALAGAVFAVHPVVVEPVAWVVGQKDVLAAAFLLLALLVRAGPRGASATSTAATAILVLASLASKPNTVGAPLMLLALDAALGRGVSDRRHIALYATTAALAILASLLALFGHDAAPVDRFGARSLIEAVWGLGLEVGHLVWPHPLLARYFPPGGAGLAAGVSLGVAAAIAIAAGLWLAVRRKAHVTAFAIAAAALAYAPVSGILPLTRGPSDSYLYLPLAIAVVAMSRAIDRALHRRATASYAAAIAIIIALGLGARAQTAVWRDAPALWAPVATVYPDEPRALMRLGDAFLFVSQPEPAVAVFASIRERFPRFATSAPSHGAALELLGRLSEAEQVIAFGARVGAGREYLESYGFFLIRHRLEPTDRDAARASLLAIAGDLAARGKRPTSLRRAAELLVDLGEPEQAARIRARLATVQSRP